MYTLLTVLAVVLLLIYLKAIVDVFLAKRRVAQLHMIEKVSAVAAPPVSVIIPACNEEQNIEEALSSVLSQEYPDLQVIAINDRSTDRTGQILARMAESRPNLKVVTISELPSHWLGKNNALHTGAAAARGEWLLFADADVVMESSAVARAINYAISRRVDHLAVAPRAVVGGFLANVFLNGFALMFAMHTRPWKVRDPKAREYIGIGAFNLVRASAYRSVGGHASIAMRPDDDLRLGKLLKDRGYRSDFLFGARLLCVEWYQSFGEMRQGLMKNMFSVLHYRLSLALGACAVLFVVFIWPFAAVLITRGELQWLYALAAACACIASANNAAIVRTSRMWCFTLPLAGLLAMYFILRAAFVTLRNRGIEWRGTHYSLEELRNSNS